METHFFLSDATYDDHVTLKNDMLYVTKLEDGKLAQVIKGGENKHSRQQTNMNHCKSNSRKSRRTRCDNNYCLCASHCETQLHFVKILETFLLF